MPTSPSAKTFGYTLRLVLVKHTKVSYPTVDSFRVKSYADFQPGLLSLRMHAYSTRDANGGKQDDVTIYWNLQLGGNIPANSSISDDFATFDRLSK